MVRSADSTAEDQVDLPGAVGLGVLRVSIGVLGATFSVGLLVGVLVAGAGLAGVVPQLNKTNPLVSIQLYIIQHYTTIILYA